ncbi:MAG: pyruvate kinase [Parcubacteria group bacterium]|nr:pyruvate kinase [Parcubacteria group bacterium]
MKRTKIVCTIGPASKDTKVLKKMIEAGMDCARLNFSHGTYAEHAELIKYIRQVAKEMDHPIAFLADLQGPRVRIGTLKEDGIKLEKGSEVVLTTNEDNGSDKIPVTYSNLHKDVGEKDILLLNDGLLKLEVVEVVEKDIKCKVILGGPIFTNKSINVSTATLNIPSTTEKDIWDLEFAVKNNVDWVALSFVKNEEDILNLKNRINKLEKKYKIKEKVKVISKIEKHEAIKNFDKILEASDGIMVARGDLGIEMPLEKLPIIQKEVIQKCLKAAKPVITATQMLLSMVENPKPTRAETSDVANAVIDHTDAVMLSQESAVGKYPVETVQTMSDIIEDAEESPYDDIVIDDYKGKVIPIDTAISSAGSTLARDTGAKAILVASISGDTARMVSRHRPELPIIVTAESEKVRRQLALSWGVVPYVLPQCGNVDELIDEAVKLSLAKKIVEKGDKIIIIGGQPVGLEGNANLIKIHEIK